MISLHSISSISFHLISFRPYHEDVFVGYDLVEVYREGVFERLPAER